ncbi:MAG TPA: DsbA family protein [Gaiellales bacterium]|nr:DsbA family protein [Gaiellales bacterium]
MPDSHRITATLHTDPGCPWGYSAIPALRVLRWRYADALDWRLVLIGLAEDARQYAERGFTPLLQARSAVSFRRYGMPFSPQPKSRVAATARACRAVAAARLAEPGSEWSALRALQLAQFTTPLLLDDDEHIARVVAAATGLDAASLRGLLDAPEVSAAYEGDRAEARSAAGSPAELQGKTAVSDGTVRYTAPSVVFGRGAVELTAGGFQPVEAYDVLIANLDPAIARRAVPEDPTAILEAFPEGVTTQEAAMLLASSNQQPDAAAAEMLLLELVAEGGAARVPVGDDAFWALPEHAGWIEGVLDEATAPRPAARSAA